MIDHALKYMTELGFTRVVRTSRTESGTDIDAEGGAARVQLDEPASVADLQRLRGAALGSSEALFFSSEPFFPAAIEFSNLANIALFRLTSSEAIEPQSLAAERLVRIGWLTTAPALATEARESLRLAVQEYAQTVVDVGEQLALTAQDAVATLTDDRDGVIDEELRARIDFASKGSLRLAALFEDLDGATSYPLPHFIQLIEQAEALIHAVAERLEIDYADLEGDAFLRTYRGRAE